MSAARTPETAAQGPAERCGHRPSLPSAIACTLDRGHKGYHRGYGYVWCCPSEVRPAAEADDLTHDAGCERQIYEVCAAPPAAPAAAAPRWLTDARGRLAAAEPIRVGSDMHLLEMACDAYEEAERERGEERRGRHDLIRRYGGNLSGILDAAPAPAEALTLDRLLRTVAQVALTTYDDRLDTCAGPAAEDRAVERTAALLTPRARLELAAELLAKVPQGAARAMLSLGDGAEALAFLRDAFGAEVRMAVVSSTRIGDTTPYVRDLASVELSGLYVQAQHTRPMTPDDARRLLEGK